MPPINGLLRYLLEHSRSTQATGAPTSFWRSAISARVSAEPKVLRRCSSKCCLAYGNRVSLTNAIGAMVPSMSSTRATGSASCVSFCFFACGCSARQTCQLCARYRPCWGKPKRQACSFTEGRDWCQLEACFGAPIAYLLSENSCAGALGAGSSPSTCPLREPLAKLFAGATLTSTLSAFSLTAALNKYS